MFNKKRRKYSSVSFDEDVKTSSVKSLENEQIPVVEEIENDVNVDEIEATEMEEQHESDENYAKIIKSELDLENENKIREILRLPQSHELTYSEVLNHFIVLFDNFNKIREEYNRFRNSSFNRNQFMNQGSFAPSWN